MLRGADGKGKSMIFATCRPLLNLDSGRLIEPKIWRLYDLRDVAFDRGWFKTAPAPTVSTPTPPCRLSGFFLSHFVEYFIDLALCATWIL
jgi:hypothetical protein